MREWLVPGGLILLLALAAAAMVASRLWLVEAHWALQREQKELTRLQLREEVLKVEWLSRTDLNVVERRAREELGMRPPEPHQWQVVEP